MLHIKRFSVKRSEKKSVLFPKDYKKIIYNALLCYIDICIVSITAVQSNAHIAYMLKHCKDACLAYPDIFFISLLSHAKSSFLCAIQCTKICIAPFRSHSQ